MKKFFFALSIFVFTTHATVIEVDGENDLNDKLKKYPNVVIKFYRPGCPHCNVIAGDYESISNAVNNVTFLADNTDKPNNRSVFPQWNVTGVPTLYFVKNGQRTLTSRDKNFRSSFEQAVKKHFNV